uniref:Sushi domain-containing protein n=1 Tax=Cyanistes caeruleus TaxID=156563 RepID=A0A8C0U0U6_CYACU
FFSSGELSSPTDPEWEDRGSQVCLRTQGHAGCRAPARLEFAELKERYRQQEVFPEGSRVEFVCQPGYTQLPGVSPAITCLRNQTWSAALQFCQRQQCPSPGDPENGRAAVLTDLLLGSRINYTCDKGYKLVGGSQRICEVSGTGVSWSGDPPVCQRITCAPPPAIPHGTHSGGSRDSFSFGDVVTYTCSSGLAPAGDASLSCSSADGQRGSWSGAVPRCQGTARGVPTASSACPPARVSHPQIFISSCSSLPATGCTKPEIENGKATGLETTYKLKDIIFFECNFGYALKGSQESQCQFGGKWHPPALQALEEALSSPWSLFLRLDKPIFPILAQHHGPAFFSVSFCPLSSVLQCPSPPNIDKGKHNSQDVEVFPSGMVVNYSCDPGYSLQGEASIYCTDSGNWSLPLPQCAGTLWF